MMGRMIDADALSEAMYHEVFETDTEVRWDSGCWIRYKIFEKVVENAPTIEKRKTGKWSIEFSPAYMGGAYCECSQCNYKFAVGAYIDPNKWDYCPKCGSTMTEGEGYDTN